MIRPVLLLLALSVTALIPDYGRSQSTDLALEQLATRSGVIAAGRVTDIRSEWNADRTRIFTHVTLAVDTYLKGTTTGNTLEVVVPGGEVDDVGERYSHVPRFSQEEVVVVFAQADIHGTLRVTGGERGKISVRRDARTDRMMVGQGEVLEAFMARVRHAVKSTQQD
jgi:hypothetical protein